MEAKLLGSLGKIAGLAGIALGLVLLIFQGVLKQQFMPLGPGRAFGVILALMILTFGIASIGVIAWLIAMSTRPNAPISGQALYLLATLIVFDLALAAYVSAQSNDDPQPQPPTSKECDKPAQYPESEQTRVSAFTYYAADPGNPGPRYWSRVAPDRWVEKSGSDESFFSVQARIRNDVCDGTVVARIGEPKFQMLISDKNCMTRALMFRRLPSCDWIGLPQMKDVN